MSKPNPDLGGYKDEHGARGDRQPTIPAQRRGSTIARIGKIFVNAELPPDTPELDSGTLIGRSPLLKPRDMIARSPLLQNRTPRQSDAATAPAQQAAVDNPADKVLQEHPAREASDEPRRLPRAAMDDSSVYHGPLVVEPADPWNGEGMPALDGYTDGAPAVTAGQGAPAHPQLPDADSGNQR